jgi:outer membrane protein OmpA-like peptidoglycan-associated protein
MEHIILFKQTSLEVLDAQGAQHKLERLLERMKKDPKFLVVIEGHTDNMGEWNNLLRLSEERAKLIRDQLIELGANPSRIQIAAYGADKPISSNETEKSRAKNRRVSFRMEELNN